jgi:hypothetical protein
MEQLMTLNIDPDHRDSVVKTFIGLRTELAKEKPHVKRLKLKSRRLPER